MQHVANKKKGKPYDDTKNLYSSSKENVVNYWSWMHSEVDSDVSCSCKWSAVKV
jgi:hypothetical protein